LLLAVALVTAAIASSELPVETAEVREIFEAATVDDLLVDADVHALSPITVVISLRWHHDPIPPTPCIASIFRPPCLPG